MDRNSINMSDTRISLDQTDRISNTSSEARYERYRKHKLMQQRQRRQRRHQGGQEQQQGQQVQTGGVLDDREKKRLIALMLSYAQYIKANSADRGKIKMNDNILRSVPGLLVTEGIFTISNLCGLPRIKIAKTVTIEPDDGASRSRSITNVPFSLLSDGIDVLQSGTATTMLNNAINGYVSDVKISMATKGKRNISSDINKLLIDALYAESMNLFKYTLENTKNNMFIKFNAISDKKFAKTNEGGNANGRGGLWPANSLEMDSYNLFAQQEAGLLPWINKIGFYHYSPNFQCSLTSKFCKATILDSVAKAKYITMDGPVSKKISDYFADNYNGVPLNLNKDSQFALYPTKNIQHLSKIANIANANGASNAQKKLLAEFAKTLRINHIPFLNSANVALFYNSTHDVAKKFALKQAVAANGATSPDIIALSKVIGDSLNTNAIVDYDTAAPTNIRTMAAVANTVVQKVIVDIRGAAANIVALGANIKESATCAATAAIIVRIYVYYTNPINLDKNLAKFQTHAFDAAVAAYSVGATIGNPEYCAVAAASGIGYIFKVVNLTNLVPAVAAIKVKAMRDAITAGAAGGLGNAADQISDAVSTTAKPAKNVRINTRSFDLAWAFAVHTYALEELGLAGTYFKFQDEYIYNPPSEQWITDLAYVTTLNTTANQAAMLNISENVGNAKAIKNVIARLSAAQASAYCIQMGYSLEVLARCGIIHNDLHAENVLVKNIPATTFFFVLNEKPNEDNIYTVIKIKDLNRLPMIIDWDRSYVTDVTNIDIRQPAAAAAVNPYPAGLPVWHKINPDHIGLSHKEFEWQHNDKTAFGEPVPIKQTDRIVSKFDFFWHIGQIAHNLNSPSWNTVLHHILDVPINSANNGAHGPYGWAFGDGKYTAVTHTAIQSKRFAYEWLNGLARDNAANEVAYITATQGAGNKNQVFTYKIDPITNDLSAVTGITADSKIFFMPDINPATLAKALNTNLGWAALSTNQKLRVCHPAVTDTELQTSNPIKELFSGQIASVHNIEEGIKAKQAKYEKIKEAKAKLEADLEKRVEMETKDAKKEVHKLKTFKKKIEKKEQKYLKAMYAMAGLLLLEG